MVSNSTLLEIGQHSDNAFGPASSTRNFDFTLTFEQSILSILPSALLLLFAPLRLFRLFKRRSKTIPNRSHSFKSAAALLNFAIQLSLLVIWCSSPALQTVTSVPAASLSFANSLIIFCLSYAEEKKSTRPSTLLNVYLIFSLLFDATQVRTLWFTSRTMIAAVQSVSLGIKLAMLFLEGQTKTSRLREPYRSYPPEAKSGILNLSFVWWLNRLFIQGFRKLMTSEDLFDIDSNLRSELLGGELQSAWDKRKKPETRYSLPKALLYCFRWDMVATMIPRTFLIAFSFAQPFLISTAIQFLESSEVPKNMNYGYGLIGATFLIYLGLAISTVHFRQILMRFLTKVRGSMISLIYNRTLTLQDGVSTDGAALTLMSVDTDAIIQYLETICDVWAYLVEISIGIWLLERQLGATCVVPLIISVGCVIGQSLVSKGIGKQQQNWNQAIQNRVKTAASMLGSMKEIKISGLATRISSNLQGMRVSELRISRPFFWTIIWTNGLARTPVFWSPVVTFIVFAVQSEIRGTSPLSTSQAFTSLSIITLVTSPMIRLLAVFPQFVALLGCFERIQAFLLSLSRNDTRLLLGSPTPSNVDFNSSSGDYELSRFQTRADGSSNAIEIMNATVFPADNAVAAAISDVTLTVKTGSLTVILGPVGSGKTTLIKAMLGELPCISGVVSVSSICMSFCSQTSWLLNTTIKDAICGPSNPVFDEEWYNTVIYSCALDGDIRQWPEGDRSIIGSKGLTLSGGQKQRVALARAVYARQDIVLLDDILSALDTKTQDLLGSRLLSSRGLFRRLGSTVVLITHTTRCLHLSDDILVLGADGKAAMQGSYSELNKRQEFAAYAAAQLRSSTEDQENLQTKADTQEAEQCVTETEPDLMDLSRRTGDTRIYRYYIQTGGLLIWAAFCVNQATASFTENFPQVWVSWWTRDGGHRLPLYLSVYAILALASLLLMMSGIWLVCLVLMPISAVRLHKRLLDSVMNAPLSFFASTDTGITLNRFSQDMSLIDMSLPITMHSTITALFDSMAKLALISTGSSYMAITIPFTLLTIYFIQDVYLKTSRQLRFLDLECKSAVYSHFLETLDGVPTIRAFGWQHASRETQNKNLDRSQRPYYMLFCVQRWLTLVLDLMVTAIAVIIVTLAVQLRSTTSAGLLGIALNNVLGFNRTLTDLVVSWTGLETSLGAIARIKTFTEVTPSEKKPGEDHALPHDWPRTGEVQINNVSATYGSSIRAFDDVNMSIHSGQKIGICGRTGSGKSSLILTLLHLVEISCGSILIDGIDIRTIPRELLRERLIAIPQDPFILSGTVRSNADPLNTAADSDIIAALTKIGIWSTLERRGGLDAVLEEQPLSQGQQQLFCLARAMLRRSKVLILDEATSSVDSETDRVMQRVIKEVFEGYTIISVAHRLDTIMDSDKIAVMDAGRLVEFDTPENLLSRDSIFRQMYRT